MTKTKPAPRSVGIVSLPEGDAPGCIRITDKGKTAFYRFREIPADFGRGFHLEKVDPEDDGMEHEYDVNVDYGRSTCDCIANSRWGKCRHVDGLKALIREKKL